MSFYVTFQINCNRPGKSFELKFIPSQSEASFQSFLIIFNPCVNAKFNPNENEAYLSILFNPWFESEWNRNYNLNTLFNAKLQSKWIRTHLSIRLRTTFKPFKSGWHNFAEISISRKKIKVPGQCKSIRKEFSISLVENRLKINPSQSETSIWTNPNESGLGLKVIRINSGRMLD